MMYINLSESELLSLYYSAFIWTNSVHSSQNVEPLLPDREILQYSPYYLLAYPVPLFQCYIAEGCPITSRK